MVFIYALQLEQGKYYIGKTNHPQVRLESHFYSEGSEWTKKYKPLCVIEIIPNCDDYDEDKYTRIYMDKYGINNVRGGSFVSVTLEKPVMEMLNQMSHGTNDKCFVCGKGGHFAKDCQTNMEDFYTINKYVEEFDTTNKYVQDFNTVEEIDIEIENITQLCWSLKHFQSNKYIEYIELPNNKKIEIRPELYSNSMINDPRIIAFINNQFAACSGKINNLFIHNSMNNNTELLKLKLNKIYIERRKKEIDYYESLPDEYAEIFKNNHYENIFELVKDKLLVKLENLYEKQARLISKIQFR